MGDTHKTLNVLVRTRILENLSHTTMMGGKPIALIVYVDTGRALNYLGEEAREVQDRLLRTDTCDVRLIPAAQAQNVFSQLQAKENRDRIVLFHYAGHANGEGVVLQSAGGRQSRRASREDQEGDR